MTGIIVLWVRLIGGGPWRWLEAEDEFAAFRVCEADGAYSRNATPSARLIVRRASSYAAEVYNLLFDWEHGQRNHG
jgi:hypothetical protein